MESRDRIYGDTPLIAAGRKCDSKAAIDLLERGANPQAQNYNGESFMSRCQKAWPNQSTPYYSSIIKYFQEKADSGGCQDLEEQLEEYRSNNEDLEEKLEQMKQEVDIITTQLAASEQISEYRNGTINSQREIAQISGNNLANCTTRKEELEGLLVRSESLIQTRESTIRECEAQKSELEHDVANISARLLLENSELADDVINARDRLMLALEDAARNSNSVQLGSLIKEMSDFMNSGEMNNHQLAIMESIMEENIRQAISPSRIELLRVIFGKIKEDVHDRKTSIKALEELETNSFKVGILTKIGAHMRLF